MPFLVKKWVLDPQKHGTFLQFMMFLLPQKRVLESVKNTHFLDLLQIVKTYIRLWPTKSTPKTHHFYVFLCVPVVFFIMYVPLRPVKTTRPKPLKTGEALNPMYIIKTQLPKIWYEKNTQISSFFWPKFNKFRIFFYGIAGHTLWKPELKTFVWDFYSFLHKNVYTVFEH